MARMHAQTEKELLSANEQMIVSFIRWLAEIYQCEVTITRTYNKGGFITNSVDCRIDGLD